MAALAQARGLPQAQLPFQEAHRLIVQVITDPASVELGAAVHEAPLLDEPALAFAVGEDIETLFDHAAEQLRTPSAAVKDDGHRPLPERRTHPAQQLGEGLGQGGIQLCGDQQQRIAAAIVDPVVGGGGHRQMAPCHVSLGNRAFPVIGAHVAIDIQEPHQLAASGHAHPSQLRAHLLGAMMGGETAERPPEGLDLGRPVKPEESAEGGRIALLELLGALHAQQRHQEQRQQRRAQSVEGGPDSPVELTRDAQHSAVHQERYGQQCAEARYPLTVTEHRCRILEQSQIRHLPIAGSIARVLVQTQRHRLRFLSGFPDHPRIHRRHYRRRHSQRRFGTVFALRGA